MNQENIFYQIKEQKMDLKQFLDEMKKFEKRIRQDTMNYMRATSCTAQKES